MWISYELLSCGQKCTKLAQKYGQYFFHGISEADLPFSLCTNRKEATFLH